MNELGVVAALAAEARLLGRVSTLGGGLGVLGDGSLLAVSGMGCVAAGLAARKLADAGAVALMSFGLAGGLDPALRAGAVLLPAEVVFRSGERFAASSDWREQLSASLAGRASPVGGVLLTSVQPLETVADKADAYRDTGAAAVDMESAAIAEVAAARQLAFVAVRVLVDTAGDRVPRAVAAASRAGEVRIWPLIRELAVTPGDVFPLIHLARRYRVAMRSLGLVARAGTLAPLQADVRLA